MILNQNIELYLQAETHQDAQFPDVFFVDSYKIPDTEKKCRLLRHRNIQKGELIDMKYKQLSAVCLATALCLTAPFSVSAAELPMQICDRSSTGSAYTQQIMDANLIVSYSLYCRKSNNVLYISSSTIRNKVLAKIGIRDIRIQRSSSGTGGWTDCKPAFDLTETETSACYVDDYAVSVDPGYYYRVTVTHYAKEKGWLFPKSQSVSQTSGVV